MLRSFGATDTSGLRPTWHSTPFVSPARLSGLLLYLTALNAMPSCVCQRGWNAHCENALSAYAVIVQVLAW